MKTTKRIVCVLCGVLALCLLFLNSTSVKASEYGTYGYSIRDINGQYNFQSFDESVNMLASLNSVATTFYTSIREEYPNGDFSWYGYSGSQIYPLNCYLPDGIIQYIRNIDLSNPEFLVNVFVIGTNNRWDNGTLEFYFTKNNTSIYTYDSDTHEFNSLPFMVLPDVVPYVVSSYRSLFDGDIWLNTDNTNTESSSYKFGISTLDNPPTGSWNLSDEQCTDFFEYWLATSTLQSFYLQVNVSLDPTTLTYTCYYGACPSSARYVVPIAIQSRVYKVNTGYSLNYYGRNGENYICLYANDLSALNETPLTYYAEPFSSYINAPWVTPTPIPVQPTRPLVLPTFQPFATPTPITGVVVPTYNTDDDPGSVIGYALGNVTSEFIKPIYSMVVSVINYMFYNNIWFSFLVVAPSIAFIVFIIGRLRKK